MEKILVNLMIKKLQEYKVIGMEKHDESASLHLMR